MLLLSLYLFNLYVEEETFLDIYIMLIFLRGHFEITPSYFL
jgi:hypothetical protein